MSTSRNLDLSKNLIILVSLKVKLQISFEYCNIQINPYIRQKLWVELKWQGMWNVDCNLSTRLISNIPTQNIQASNTPQIKYPDIKYLPGHPPSTNHCHIFRLTLEQNWSGWRSGWPRPRRSLTEERLWLVSKQSWPRAEKYVSLQKPDSIVDACQALSKARELRAQFEKKEKPLITAKVQTQREFQFLEIMLSYYIVHLFRSSLGTQIPRSHHCRRCAKE